MKYGAGTVKQTKSELEETDRKTRKVITLNKELHPRNDIDKLYVQRKKIAKMQVCVEAEQNSLEWYVKHHIKPFIVVVRISNRVPSENSTQPKEFKQQDNEERLNNWREKAIYRQHVRQTEDKDKRNTRK